MSSSSSAAERIELVSQETGDGPLESGARARLILTSSFLVGSDLSASSSTESESRRVSAALHERAFQQRILTFLPVAEG